MTTSLPAHIGGYQSLSPEIATLPDDILVLDGVPRQFVGSWAPGSVASLHSYTGMNAYRKIPVAKQGDASEGWRKVLAIAAHDTGVLTATEGQSEAARRKGIPIATGFLDYFPDAIAAVAELSRIGNDQHNPGKALHWDRSKSGDEADALMRHFMERGTVDSDGVRHSTKTAWRALALLQKEIEASRA